MYAEWAKSNNANVLGIKREARTLPCTEGDSPSGTADDLSSVGVERKNTIPCGPKAVAPSVEIVKSSDQRMNASGTEKSMQGLANSALPVAPAAEFYMANLRNCSYTSSSGCVPAQNYPTPVSGRASPA